MGATGNRHSARNGISLHLLRSLNRPSSGPSNVR